MNNSIDTRHDNGVQRLTEQSKPATGKTGNAGVHKQDISSSAKPADQLDLTAKARSLNALEEQIHQAPDVDQQRITELRQALKDGTYEINPTRIADKLLALDALLPK